MRKLTTLRTRTFALTAATAVGLLGVTAQAQDNLEKEILGTRMAQNTANASSQAAIDRMANETDDKLAKLKLALEQIESLEKYNAITRKLIAAQEEEKTSLSKQIDGVTEVERNILPLMSEMITALKQFVDLDVPFLLEERRERVANLQDLMEQADVTVAEKYRRLTEAYLVEDDYGRSMEAYNGTLQDGREVEFLRVGRVLLMYRTPNGDEAAYWDKEAGKFVEMSSSYRNSLDQAIRIARKQVPPNMVSLPVPGPESAAQ